MPRPVLFVNPISDTEFATEAEGLVESGIDDPSELERMLRDRYPRAVVRARDISGERQAIWYVYREGRWTDGERGAE